ncbi:unnamed protein product [Dibothriocephalus latus]|uniref:Reverse transcriptase domain-containing protein n=1 Tax=Dibothriocephalus latus TaxID=60516 RepID=A0A3P6QPX8_DIBLA|nr:unnamed protein product [Dibothriocephalus latus]
MDTMLTGNEKAAAYLDDIIVTGSNLDELLQRLETMLSRIQDHGFHLRLEKCVFMRTVEYLGFIIDKDGRRPDPENINVIKQRPPPKDINSLRAFMGLMSH